MDFLSSRATVREMVPVCLPRDGNGTGKWKAIRFTRRDGSARFLGGTESWNGSVIGREIGQESRRESLGNIVSGKRSGTQSGLQSGI